MTIEIVVQPTGFAEEDRNLLTEKTKNCVIKNNPDINSKS